MKDIQAVAEAKRRGLEKLNEVFIGSLRELAIPKRVVLEREKEKETLSVIMSRRETPVCMLLGEAGSGKTEIVRSWYAEEKKKSNLQMLALSLGRLSGEGKEKTQELLARLLYDLEKYQEEIRGIDSSFELYLFIDEIHAVNSIFGEGTKTGGELLKEPLATPPIKIITATTRAEYDTYIAIDDAFARRFTELVVGEVSPKVTKIILRNWIDTYLGKDFTFSEELLEKIIEINHIYRPNFYEPAKSLKVLETVVSYHETLGQPIEVELINRVFENQFNVVLDKEVNTKKVIETINSEIIGQPLAKFAIKKVVNKLNFRLKNKKGPKDILLFTGPTGVGKTAMAKSFTKGMYGSEDKLVIMNMTNYSRPEDEPLFRRMLGQIVSHQATCNILLDELEKADKSVLLTLLSIYDTGIVSYVEEREISGFRFEAKRSVSNCIFMSTTNSGASMFRENGKYSVRKRSENLGNLNTITNAIKKEYIEVKDDILEALQKDFNPEFLARHKHIVPFWALSEPALIQITENHLTRQKSLIEEIKGIKMKYLKPKYWETYKYKATELAMFVVHDNINMDDSNAGGARAIENAVDDVVMDVFYETVNEYPEEKSFLITLKDGEAKFCNPKMDKGAGEVIVLPERLVMEKQRINKEKMA